MKFTLSFETNISDFKFPLCAYVKDKIPVGSELINIADLQNKPPQLAPNTPTQILMRTLKLI